MSFQRVGQTAVDASLWLKKNALCVLLTVGSRFFMFGYLKSFTRVPFPFLVFIGYQPYSDL